MQRKHFKGLRAVDRVSRVYHRLSNSLNISGIGHPRKFLFPFEAILVRRLTCAPGIPIYGEHNFPIAALWSDYPIPFSRNTCIYLLIYNDSCFNLSLVLEISVMEKKKKILWVLTTNVIIHLINSVILSGFLCFYKSLFYFFQLFSS